jgi:hypothetical protein
MRVWLILLVVLVGSAQALAAAEPRRFALVVGENTGEGADETLKFAEADARRFLDALVEVGGVQPADAVALFGAKAQTLREALSVLKARLGREARAQDQLVVYISSHADEGDLRLAGTRFALAELTQFLRAAPVGIALLVVDSCRSGALTRAKGLRALSGTAVNVEAPEVSGRVIISSSGADEYAQESDSLGGSYFTHHLVSALRGAGDTTRDGRVTLQEAYAYAYARTVESTFGTRGGVQHPSYSVDLKGRGDLVLTEVERGRGKLAIDVAQPGEWMVVSEQDGHVLGRIAKGEGPLVLAVKPGDYRVRLRRDAGYDEARVGVANGAVARVRRADLVAMPGAASLGGMKGPMAPSAGGRAWAVGLTAAVGTGAVRGVSPVFGAELSAAYRPEQGVGPLDTVALYASVKRGRARGAVRFREVEWELAASATKAALRGPVRVELGVELGAAVVRQDLLPAAEVTTGVVPRAGAALLLTGPRLGARVRPFLHASGGPAWIPRGAAGAVGLTAQAGLGLAADL